MTGEEFKRARVRKKITQKRLGEMLGYTGATAQRTVQFWEAGQRDIPIKDIRRLSEILEVPIEKFIP